MNNVPFIIAALLVLVYVFHSIRKGTLGISISFAWIFIAIGMVVLAIWPKSLDWVAAKLNVEYPPALLLTACIVFLIILVFRLEKKADTLQKKIDDLSEEINILEIKDGK